MCWACENPGTGGDDHLAGLCRLIARHGWAVQGVERDRARPPWAYTAGLTGHRKPELVVTGLPLQRAAALLNDVAAHMLHAVIPEPGQQVQLDGGPLIEIVRVAEPAVHLCAAVSLFGTRIRALQVVHADGRGHWPWDPGYRGVRGGQPVLGPRTAQPARP